MKLSIPGRNVFLFLGASVLKKLSLLLLLVAVAVGCEKKEELEDTVDLPSYGVSCPGTSGAGNWIVNRLSYTAGSYVEDINGSSITSITFHDVATLNSSYSNFDFTITARACAFNGTILGTASAQLASLNPSSSEDLTFTFSSPLTVPTNCSSGKKTVVFVVVNDDTLQAPSGVSDGISAGATPVSSQCSLLSTSSTTAPLGTTTGSAIMATIVATP